MLGLWVFKRMLGHVAMNRFCDDEDPHQGRLENGDVTLTPLPRGFFKEAMRIINPDRSVQVPGTMLDNGWEGELSCRKLRESAPVPVPSRRESHRAPP